MGIERIAFVNDTVTVMNVSKWGMLAFYTVTFTKRRMLFWEPIAMLCRKLMQAATVQSTVGLFTNTNPPQKGTISISNRSHFHTNTETASAAAKVWQLLPPVFLPIVAYKFTSLLLPVWLMSVIMALPLFTQHIWPSPLSAICWLTSSTFYWLSLMGQLKVIVTGLWNVTAFSLMIVCEIGARKGIF